MEIFDKQKKNKRWILRNSCMANFQEISAMITLVWSLPSKHWKVTENGSCKLRLFSKLCGFIDCGNTYSFYT